MGEWKMVRLGDVCTKITDGSHNPPKGVDTSNYLMLSSKNVYDNRISFEEPRYLSSEDFIIENKRTNVEVGHVLLTIVGTVGRCAVVNSESPYFTLQRSVAVIKPKSNVIISRYLMYSLQSMRKKLEAEARGVAQKGIYLKQVSEILVPLPPLDVQQKIADALGKASALIELRRAQLDKLDLLIKSQFIEMFGTEYELDKWDCTAIENTATVTVGVVIKPAQYYTDESNGVKTFRSLNIGEMYVRDGNWVYFTPEGHAANKKSMLQTGDVLVVRSGYPGTSCVVTEEYAGCNAIDIIIARPDMSKVNPVYLCAFNNLPHGQIQIKAKTGGAAQQHFNIGAYKDMTISMPPLELQNQFATFDQQIEQQKNLIQQSLSKLELNYKSLMQKCFRGELF